MQGHAERRLAAYPGNPGLLSAVAEAKRAQEGLAVPVEAALGRIKEFLASMVAKGASDMPAPSEPREPPDAESAPSDDENPSSHDPSTPFLLMPHLDAAGVEVGS